MRKTDIRDIRFDCWVALRETRNGYWLCRCDCGFEKEVLKNNLVQGRSRSCGCNAPYKDLTGKVFTRLTVIEKAPSQVTNKERHTMWKVRCQCGTEKIVSGKNLQSHHTKSCGCLGKSAVWLHLDISGKRFGRLKVLEKVGVENDRTIWRTLCDCGAEKTIAGSDLTYGNTKSCGCLKYTSRMLSFGRAARNNMYEHYRLNCAKKRNLPWDLTNEQFDKLTQENCYYCGMSPSNRCRGSKLGGDFVYNGLDRKNNDLGYVIENVVTCCKHCNRAKSSLSFLEFIAYIKRLCTHFQNFRAKDHEMFLSIHP